MPNRRSLAQAIAAVLILSFALALPMAAAIAVLLRYAMRLWINSDAYQGTA